MRKLVMAMTCYGSYIDTFYRYCLPSLMAPGNIPTLMKQYDIEFVIHTDNAGLVHFKDFPNVVCDVDAGDKYEMIGRHQRLDLNFAKNIGADYHLLMPDFIYSANCFAGVMKAVERGHKAIARLVISAVQENITASLDRPHSSVELATLSLKHMHPRVKSWMALKDGQFPNLHVQVWHCGYTLKMCSPHATPVFIANEVIKIPPVPLAIDSVLDMAIEGKIYFPKPTDGIVIIEISPLDSPIHKHARVNANEFVSILKGNTRYSAALQQLFFEETIDEVSSCGDWSAEEAQKQKELITRALNGDYL